jgi:hypothetical protein
MEAVMHKARAFFFICAGLLCLAIAYHLGATSVQAQEPGNPIVGFSGPLVCTANGDIYGAVALGGNASAYGQWTRVGNVFTGQIPTQAAPQPTWGQVKAKYATPGVKVTR